MFSFSDKFWSQYTDWQDEDKKTVKKINRLLKSIERDGAMEGEGQPEREIKKSSRHLFTPY